MSEQLAENVASSVRRWMERRHKCRHPLLAYYPTNQLVHTARGIVCASDKYLRPCRFGIFNIFAWTWGGVATTAEVR